MTDIPHRSAPRSPRRTWLGLFVCLVVLVVSDAANAHGSAAAQSLTIAPGPPPVAVSAAHPSPAADEHPCPTGSGHRQHRACASSGVCHAMAMVQDINLPLSAGGTPAEAPIAAAIAGGNVAPPFHPPKSPRRV
jgi:hypothetical protein